MYNFQVNDMTCGHCVQTVEKAIKAVDPAANVQIDLGNKDVMIDSTEKPEQFKAAIEEAGYTPHLKA